MRRLVRRLFTLCSAASLLLCVAVCVLWVRGRRGATDMISFRDGGGAVTMVMSSEWRLGVRRISHWPLA